MADERLVRIARELESRDERLADAIAEVGELEDEAEGVRERAAALAAVIARAPAARASAAEAVREAEEGCERRRREHEQAAAELAGLGKSRDGEHVEAARRAEARALDALGLAERKLARAVDARSEVERQVEEAAREQPELEDRARGLAARLAGVPRISHGGAAAPGPGLDGAIEWGGRARAALFVVRGSLEAERERVVREANELAASALGEVAGPTSVALVRARLERA